MPIPAKACEGRFSDEVQEVLISNRDRSQWSNQACEVCGAMVGAVQVKGKWVPEQHWPTVKYLPRVAKGKKQDVSADRMVPQDDALLAGSSSR
jgi:hypothetical protein